MFLINLKIVLLHNVKLYLFKWSCVLPNLIYFCLFQKLSEIAKLKEQQASGKQLEQNKKEKIQKEEELTKELNELLL